MFDYVHTVPTSSLTLLKVSLNMITYLVFLIVVGGIARHEDSERGIFHDVGVTIQ